MAKDKEAAAEEKAERERAQKEAEEALALAKKKADEAWAKRGKEIKTKCIATCFYGGAHYKVGSKGPTFYGEITCKHFTEA